MSKNLENSLTSTISTMPDHLPISNPLTGQLNVSPYDLYDQYKVAIKIGIIQTRTSKVKKHAQ